MSGIDGLDDIRPVLAPLAERFTRRGHRLFLVGGAVRDLVLASIDGRSAVSGAGTDLDMTTDARPDVIKELLRPDAEALWTQGERFGTIGARIGGFDLEVTTHRAEAYEPGSRKPVVSFGDDLREDLSRRDFTINAMAIEVPGEELRDPFGGLADLRAGRLRTPLSPEVSFTDDPLRMLRAARFLSRFALTARPELTAAATELADRLSIVSVERIADELERLLTAADPGPGLEFLRSTGLLGLVVTGYRSDPAAAAIAAGLAAEPGPALVRRGGLLWPAGAAAGETLRRLRYPNDDRVATERVLAAVRTLLAGGSTPPDIRRVAASVGPGRLDAVLALIDRLGRHDPDVAGDRAAAIRREVERLRADEDLGDLGSPLSGAEIMATVGIEPGPDVGRAMRYLISHRLDHGPLGPSDARDLLVRWWRQESDGEGSLP